MSNWKTIKTVSELKLEGILFDAEFRDKTLSAVTLTDAKGQAVRFVLESYAVRAMVPAIPEKKSVHVVKGQVPTLGAPIREEFESAYEATTRRSELESAGVIENAAIGIEDVDIPF